MSMSDPLADFLTRISRWFPASEYLPALRFTYHVAIRKFRARAAWLVLASLTIAIVLPLWRPMAVAWLCYSRYQSGTREPARVLHRIPGHGSWSTRSGLTGSFPLKGRAASISSRVPRKRISIHAMREIENPGTIEMSKPP